ncbi:phosphomannomutase/phosphoglucomutase [Coralloluteibacterium stylophorae]|uniref:phosphomannomutase n=2 Tax=Coralloluteibacterium stylophorae TaxID=1776034 RepID=A0AAP2CES3_9GAMM|nr:phosphomannomutase/phosphoglucomutase [Coralloluteibacterium stylophorae]
MDRLLPLFAVIALGLAVVFALDGWQQGTAERKAEQVHAARDRAVQALAARIEAERARFAEHAERAAVAASLAGDDRDAAGIAFARDWPDADVEMLSPDLSVAYSDPATFGFSKLALLEAALADNGLRAAVVKDGADLQFALAGPLLAEGAVRALAYVRLPLATLEFPATVPGNGYLALRQRAFTVRTAGDAGLAAYAESAAAPVGETGLRVAAAAPAAVSGYLGLGRLPEFVLAGALALAGIALLVGRRKVARRRGARREVASPTLAEALAQEPTGADAKPAAPGARPERPVSRGLVALDPGIFRAYDIRGVIGRSLDAGIARQIGQAIGTVMQEQGLREIVVGRDGRSSSPSLSDALIEGLRLAGRDVIDIGQAPTPVAYFAAYHLRTGSAVAVTGSHNPPDYNGFKIVLGAETLAGEAIADLHARIAGDALHTAETQGGLQFRNVADDYLNRIAGDVLLERPLRVVVDAGSGVAGAIAPRVLEAIGAEVEPLYCEVDGSFPHHHPDPSDPANLADLIENVKLQDADLGIAFDGDGDRLGVVTRRGDIVYPDHLLMLFAADVLERNPGAAVIYDVKCSGVLSGHILRSGGSPLMWKTGHSLVKAKMRETGAELAGEMSGHFFFKERWYGFDDGIYAAARLLEIIAAQDRAAEALFDELPQRVATPEIKVETPEGANHAFIERFREQAAFEGARVSTIDGVRADWPDGFGLIRASNTMPVLVLRFDAADAAALERIQSAFAEQIHALDPELALPF